VYEILIIIIKKLSKKNSPEMQAPNIQFAPHQRKIGSSNRLLQTGRM
jgi:hypothetical protein